MHEYPPCKAKTFDPKVPLDGTEILHLVLPAKLRLNTSDKINATSSDKHIIHVEKKHHNVRAFTVKIKIWVSSATRPAVSS
jgi:hypothetical protein